MNCPKCGVAQDDEREDCVSCGIIFARWHEMQDRMLLSRGRSTVTSPMPAGSGGIPLWMAGIAVLIIVLFGAIWTRWRREERAKVDLAKVGKEMLNERNRQIVKNQQRFADEAAQARALAGPESGNKPLPRPVGFSESDATALLQQCSAFTEAFTVHLPKRYGQHEGEAMNVRYPFLERAQNTGVLQKTVDDGVVTNSVGQGSGGMRIVDLGSEIVVEMGLRRIESIRRLSGGLDTASAEFTWNYEDRVAAGVLMPGERPSGSAQFLKSGGVWRVKDAVLWERSESVTKLCQ